MTDKDSYILSGIPEGWLKRAGNPSIHSAIHTPIFSKKRHVSDDKFFLNLHQTV